MKTRILCVLVAVFFINCKSETKDGNNIVINNKAKIDTIENTKNYEIAPVNFLDEKYKKNGFVLPDNSIPTYPSYTFSDSNGFFSVNYIGKTELEQYYWDIKNTTGFFSQFENIDVAIGKSKIIDQKIKDVLKNKSNEYYIVADLLTREGISKYDDSGDFELKEDALTYFYLYENNKWVFIKKVKTNKINKEGLSLYNDLLLEYKLKNAKSINKKFQGQFSVYVETEFTTNGMASITYYFTISKNKALLKTNSYHEPILCNGEYKTVEKGNILELYYVENEDERCKQINNSFSIKKENNKYFIKGVGGEGTFNEWIELTKRSNAKD